MHQLAVGQPYNPNRRSWPTTEQVRIDRATAELVRFWPQPDVEEVRAHDNGAAQFALVDESPDLLILAYKFGDLSWSDSPFQAHRMTTEGPGWPAGGPGSGIAFRTTLVDSVTGVVVSLRYDNWNEEFSNAVRVAVAEQLIHHLDEQAAGQRLKGVYDRFSTPEEMVRHHAIAMCHSGEPAMGGKWGPVTVHHY